MFSLIAEYPVSSALFLVVLFCIFQALFLKKDFFSPMNVYCFSQCITLGIAYLQLDYAMSDFHLSTWLMWIGALISFSSGCILSRLYAKTKGVSVTVQSCTLQTGYNWKLHVLFSFGAFCFFLIGIFGIIHTAGNLLVFVDNPGQWMSADTDYGYFPLFFSSGPLCVLLFGIASFSRFNGIKHLRVISRVMILVTIALNFMAYPNRGALFFSLGFIVILFNYLHKRISPLWIILCLALSIGAFVGISSLRDQYGGDSIQNVAAKKVMLLPYMYVSNNYWNFDYAVNPPSDREYHPHTYGIDFFHGIFEFTGISGGIRRSYRWDSLFDESIQKMDGFNTASYLWEVYKDLWIPGIFLLPFFCGLALSLLHLKLCKPFTPRTIMFYALFIYFIGWWFFTPGYKQGIYWIWMGMMFFISTVCMRYKPLPGKSAVLDEVATEEERKEEIPA